MCKIDVGYEERESGRQRGSRESERSREISSYSLQLTLLKNEIIVNFAYFHLPAHISEE